MTKHRRFIINFLLVLATLLGASIIVFGSLLLRSYLEWHIATLTNSDIPTSPNRPFEQPTLDLPGQTTPPDSSEIAQTNFIDLQSIVDQWISSNRLENKAGVMIYDLDNNRTAASYNSDRVFDVASLYKLLFVYDGYRQINLGLISPDNFYINTSSKGSLTFSQCLDLMIRESYNGCADVVASNRNNISRVNNLIRELGMTSTYNIGLESTAADLTLLLRAYWQHTDFDEATWNQIADSMLYQPPSAGDSGNIYDWRQGLPAGFSDQVNVYNKVGWEWNGSSWNIYADAAILDFLNLDHHYTVVVITKNLTNHSTISQLGRMIEDTIELYSIDIIK